MTETLRNFASGFSTPVRAIRLWIRTPRLILLSFIPWGLTVGLWSLGIEEIFRHLSQNDKNTYAWIAAVFLTMLALISFSFVSALIATPFLDLLSMATEKQLRPQLQPVNEVPFFSRAQLRLIAIDLMKTVAAWIVTLAAWAVSWIPFVSALSIVLTSLCMAFVFLSYPQTRRGFSVSTSIGQMLRAFPLVFGFGCVTLVLSSVPFLSGFFIPVHVIGGTLIYAKIGAPKSNGADPDKGSAPP